MLLTYDDFRSKYASFFPLQVVAGLNFEFVVKITMVDGGVSWEKFRVYDKFGEKAITDFQTLPGPAQGS